MIRITSHVLIGLTFLALGCHRADGASPASAVDSQSQAPTTQDGPQAPALVRWVLVERSESLLKLRAEVLKQSPFEAPLTVKVQVPVGVRLVEGTDTWEVAADAPRGVHSRDLVFTITGTATEPISLTADAREAGFGVHATDTFRVAGGDKASRSGDEQSPMPRPAGPSIKVGNTDYGQAVPSP